MLTDFTSITAILRQSRTIAVVGLSPKPHRPSHQVAGYLLAVGYTVIPVNPGQREILGLPCYPELQAVPGPVDIVNIFRRPAQVPAIVEQAISIRARVIWMQEGIIHREAARRAREAGLLVVMDRCLKVDHRVLLGSSSAAASPGPAGSQEPG